MSTTIDAGAAKLAGLQIDLLQKMRKGHVTTEQLEWFLGLKKEQRDRLVAGEELGSKPIPKEMEIEPIEKFVEFANLGIIEVPAGYVHETRMDTFKEKNEDKFKWGYNPNITDENFGGATVKLAPGRKFQVKAYKQCVPGTTTSEERMTFLDSKKAVHLGAQGTTLVWEQKRVQLPRGYWYCSFDKKEALPVVDGNHGVPDVSVSRGGDFSFILGDFERVWYDDDVLLCFCEILPSETVVP